MSSGFSLRGDHFLGLLLLAKDNLRGLSSENDIFDEGLLAGLYWLAAKDRHGDELGQASGFVGARRH